ncbi:MAG: D-glycerate dehydrogenase [Deltaproteobacteria bacterium]|nr:MAG: D-glycerate dehydrogenase [Deltaproteobacteria bacterium]
MAKIFVTRELPGKALAQLRQHHDVLVHPGETSPTTDELKAGVKDADILICLLTDSIDQNIISAGSKLKIIGNYAVGTNNIDVDWATVNDIAVLNTPGVLTDASADMAFALLLATARRLGEADRFVRDGKWSGWDPTLLLGTQVTGKTLGIVGMGRIGIAMAQRAKGFGMRILYTNRQPVPAGLERDLGATFVELSGLIEKSDFVSLHCPLTPTTRHLFNAKVLSAMKPGSILINTARGPVVDEAALVEALENGPLRAAGLDVFEDEPNVHPKLKTLPNVLLAPHVGSATVETRSEMADLLVRGIQTLLRDEQPNNLVNPEVFG